MRAGRLRQRVTLMRATSADDALGQSKLTWSAVGTYWAEVRPLQGRELVHAQQLRADATDAVTLRYVGAISAEDRLAYRGRTLQVLSVINADERRRQLDLLCNEVTTP